MGDGDDLIDDASISSETVILRRIPPNWLKQLPDGRPAPESGNFKDDADGECCVDLMVDEEQISRILEGHDDFGLVGLTAEEIRNEGLGIVRNPIDGNPHHALITGNKTKRRRRNLANYASSRWIVLPKTP